MKDKCEHLDDILRTEIPIIKRHLNRHKWYQHLPDDNTAMIDFIEKYGFIMREYYCGYICKDRYNCELVKEYIPKNDNQP
jgi:hypothetical protein